MDFLKLQFCFAASQDIIDIARKVVLWLIEQRNDGGAFSSTQDTVIGLQALATYQMWIADIVRSSYY